MCTYICMSIVALTPSLLNVDSLSVRTATPVSSAVSVVSVWSVSVRALSGGVPVLVSDAIPRL